MDTSPPLPSPPADDSAWRPRLLASLRDCGVQPTPRSGTDYRLLAILLILALAVVSLIGEHLLKNLRTDGHQIVAWILRIIWLLFCVLFAYRFRNWLLRQLGQGSAASAEDELQRPDARRSILYLRSFQLDDRMSKRTWTERFFGGYPSAAAEQAMTTALESTGPAIAIGRPDERLPPLGAARFYVSHDRWQQKVQDVAAEAQFVVLATGTTEGLRWEISHLVATVMPQKLILWAHPNLLQLSPPEREAEWGRFRDALGDVFPKPLPEVLGEARFLYFTEDWAPHPVAPPRLVMPWFEPNRAALRGVLDVKSGVATASQVDYAGPGDDTFADLIGATGPIIDWPRAGGLFAALAAIWWTSPRVTPLFSDFGLLWAALITAVTVPAFRYLRAGIAPVVAAAAIAIPCATFEWVFDRYFGWRGHNLLSGLGQTFVVTLAGLAGLSWAVRRMGPRPFALWFGAMWYPLALWLLRQFSGDDAEPHSGRVTLPLLFGPIVFTAVMELADRLMIPKSQFGTGPLSAGALAGDGSWRPRLLASLRDCGVQRSPRSGVVYWIVAGCLVAVLTVISLIVRTFSRDSPRPEDGFIVEGVWELFCFFFAYRLRNWLWRQAWQRSAASAEDELVRRDARRPILYLRSFQLDDRIDKRTWFQWISGSYPSETAEQAMTKTLRKTGPTIAIGRPDERLPPLGAARFYVSHDRWQQKVQDVAAEAQFVVLATGTTEGLRWEVSHLVATVPPQKIILWAHPQLLRLSPEEREAEWTKFRATLGNVFPKPLPERLGEARFLYFTEDWVPHMVAPPHWPIPWLDPTRASLRRVLAVKTGIAEGLSPRRWVPRLGLTGFTLVLVAALAVGLAVMLPDWAETSRLGATVTSVHSFNDSEDLGPLLLAESVLAVLTLSLVFGRWTWLRRLRLVGIAFLAVFVLLAAIVFIQYEFSRVRTDPIPIWPDRFNNFAKDEKLLAPGQVPTMSREVALGAYVKFGLATLIAALSLRLMFVGWRWTEADAQRIPVSSADIDYAGPGDDTFADLIGVTGPDIRWPRVAGLFVALAAMGLLSNLVVHQSFSVLGLMWAALIAAASVAAFRFLRPGTAPVIAAAAVAILWAVIFGRWTPHSDFGGSSVESLFAGLPNVGRSFVEVLALLAGVSWAVRRMGPRPFALWFGAMWGALALFLMRLDFSGNREPMHELEVVSPLLQPVVFAAVMELAVRLAPARPVR
jgi:hypothetical protein